VPVIFDIFNENGNIIRKKGGIIDAGFLLKINFLKIYRKKQNTVNSVLLNDLLISEYNQNIFKTAIQNKKGIFLIACPENSGKSLLLNSLIDNLKSNGLSTVIINNLDIDSISSIKHFNIANLNNERVLEVINSALCDKETVIGIDDINEPSVINRIFEMSPDNKIIFLTFNASNSFDALAKLENIVDKTLLSANLKGIFSQKLIPALCANCKEGYYADSSTLSNIFKCDQNDKLYLFNSKGCPTCDNKGYSGFLGIHEFLEINNEIKEILKEDHKTDQIKNIAYKSNFQNMKQDFLKKILCGLIPLAEYFETL